MDKIQHEVKNSVSIIRFNNPEKKNALDFSMYQQMTKLLHEAENNPDILVHVFLGSKNIFCSGNDLGDFLSSNDKKEQKKKFQVIIYFLKVLVNAIKPIIAGIDGPAIGIGATMLFHCDMIFATPRSVLKTPFVDLGLIPEAASTLLAPKLIGYHRAFELLVAGIDFSAAKAKDIGLINNIVYENQVEDITLNTAEQLASKPRESLLITKTLLKGMPEPILDRIDIENDVFLERLETSEVQARINQFFGKNRL